MDLIELVAIIILIAAIVFLIYYYIQTVNGGSIDMGDIKAHFTVPKKEAVSSAVHLDDELKEKVSMGEKIKYTFKDIDKSYANTTDAFSKRLDSFLDERSEELIENWSLVTTDDLESLEQRCVSACDSIDDLEKRFSEYSNVTNEKIDDLDKRLKALEDESELLDETKEE